MNRRPMLLFVLACAFAVNLAHAGSLRDSKPVRVIDDTARGTVRFDLYRDYLIVAHGSAGPLKGLNFLVDTGTSRSILDSRTAAALHLESEGPSNIVILGGRARGEEVTLPSLGFGPVRQSNFQVVTADLSFFSKLLPVRIDAVVGLDAFGQNAFVLDYSAREIRFGLPPVFAVSIPLRLDRGLAAFDVEVDHAPLHLVFDTGAASFVLFDTTRPSGSSPKADAIQDQDKIGNFARRDVRLRSVRLGDEEFREKPAILVSNPKPSQLDFDGMMSPAALGISRVSIDLKGGILTFSR